MSAAKDFYYPDAPVSDYEPEYSQPAHTDWMERTPKHLPCKENRSMPKSSNALTLYARPQLSLVPMSQLQEIPAEAPQMPSDALESNFAALEFLSVADTAAESCMTVLSVCDNDAIMQISADAYRNERLYRAIRLKGNKLMKQPPPIGGLFDD